MTFKQLQDEMIDVPAARFKETQRASVQKWINYAGAQLWSLDDWTFRQATAAPTVTAGSRTVGSVPSDFSASLGFWRADGQPLNYLKPRQFFNRYQGDSTSAQPVDFTIIDGAFTVGPTSSETATYQLLYERSWTDLADDNDVPAIPEQFHYLLVHGATVIGLVSEQDFTFQFHMGQWQQGIQTMQFEYADDQRGQPGQFGSWDSTGSWGWRE